MCLTSTTSGCSNPYGPLFRAASSLDIDPVSDSFFLVLIFFLFSLFFFDFPTFFLFDLIDFVFLFCIILLPKLFLSVSL